jgi:hypothetical protein
MSDDVVSGQKENDRQRRRLFKSQPSTRDLWGIRTLFGMIGSLLLTVAIGQIVTGKIWGRHGEFIADRSASPFLYWFFVLLFLLAAAIPLFVVWITFRKGKRRTRR